MITEPLQSSAKRGFAAIADALKSCPKLLLMGDELGRNAFAVLTQSGHFGQGTENLCKESLIKKTKESSKVNLIHMLRVDFASPTTWRRQPRYPQRRR